MKIRKHNNNRKAAILATAATLHRRMRQYLLKETDAVAFLEGADGVQEDVTARARKAADVLHQEAGGSREKRTKIQEIWASGKYTSRDRCAEKEGEGLGMSYSTARKALRNTPNPPSRSKE